VSSALESSDRSREDLALLLPLRDAIAHRAAALRVELTRAEPLRHERLYSRATRRDRLVRLLDTRIRLAAELLAKSEPQSVRVASLPKR
jgi:hypothetical protein